MRGFALVLVALLLAGCARPEAASDDPAPGGAGSVQAPSACAARFAGPPAGNAPLLVTLQDDPEVVVQRAAEAVGERIEGAPEVVGDRGLRWRVSNGTLQHDRASEDRVQVLYASTRPTDDATGRAWLDALQSSFAVPAAELATRDDGALVLAQRHAGEPIRFADAVLVRTAEGATLAFGPFHDVRVDAPKPDAELLDVARRYADCALEEPVSDARPDGYAVRASSLSRVVHVAFEQRDEGCAGTYTVYVDVETGAVHDAPGVQCR